MASNAIYYLKTSRPGLWFATLWLYFLPTSLSSGIHESWAFWLGLAYVTFPLNFMVYGWNDAVDFETDQLNPRKDSFWFGARGTKSQLKRIWKPIVVSQIIFLPFVVWAGGLYVLVIFIGFILPALY